MKKIVDGLKEMYPQRLSQGGKVFIVIALLGVLFLQSIDAGESIGRAIYNLTH